MIDRRYVLNIAIVSSPEGNGEPTLTAFELLDSSSPVVYPLIYLNAEYCMWNLGLLILKDHLSARQRPVLKMNLTDLLISMYLLREQPLLSRTTWKKYQEVFFFIRTFAICKAGTKTWGSFHARTPAKKLDMFVTLSKDMSISAVLKYTNWLMIAIVLCRIGVFTLEP